MPFLTDDDTNIIMDNPDTGANPYLPGLFSRPLLLDDLKRLRDAGATVALESVPWDRMEQARGATDWRMPDEAVERCHKAGLKVLLMGPTSIPQWCPDDWYVRLADGTPLKDHDSRNVYQTWGCFSPWNQDAMAYLGEWIAKFCARYNSADTLCIGGLSQEGESLLPPAGDALFDLCAVRSHIERYGDAPIDSSAWWTKAWMYETLADTATWLQLTYCNAHPSRTVVMTLHPCYQEGIWSAGGVFSVDMYLQLIKRLVAPGDMRWLIFTWFASGFESKYQAQMQKARGMGIKIITGGEWCDGLKPNTPKAIEQGIGALLTAPLHPYLRLDAMEPWMFDAVRDSRRQFMEARG